MKTNDYSLSESGWRQRRRPRRLHSVDAMDSNGYGTRPSKCFLRIFVAVLFLRTEAFHFRSSARWQSKPIKPSVIHQNTILPNLHHTQKVQSHQNSMNLLWNNHREIESAAIIARFAELPTKSMQENASKTEITPDSSSTSSSSSSSSSSLRSTQHEGADAINGNNTDTTTKPDLFFAEYTSNATTSSSSESDLHNSENYILDEKESDGERIGAATRRDAFRYATALASAVWITGLTFTHTDPSRTKPRESKTASLPSPLPSSPEAVQTPRLEPVNLTKVASQTNINVTINCEKMCVSIDSSNFTFNKVERAKTPDWLPSWLRPRSQVVKKIPNTELLVAATVAGSAMEMVRTSLLYPLQTVKVRLQADRNENISQQGSKGRPSLVSLPEQMTTLGSNIRRKMDEGDLYAGISPALLVSVPATGIYYGVRDVTKRLLFMTPLDSTWIAVGGALVGDVVSLCFRVPSDALSTRLQANTTKEAGDWLGDSFRTLPMVILTDLPYLICKILLNKNLIQGNMSVSEYALLAAFASIVAGFLTTPFDVARTRILLNKWSKEDQTQDEENLSSPRAASGNPDDDVGFERVARSPPESTDSASSSSSSSTTTTSDNPGNSVYRTMIQITEEGDGGIENLFSGWLERVVYLGIGRAWLEPIQLIGYIGIRDAVLLEWF